MLILTTKQEEKLEVLLLGYAAQKALDIDILRTLVQDGRGRIDFQSDAIQNLQAWVNSFPWAEDGYSTDHLKVVKKLLKQCIKWKTKNQPVES